jgi:PHD/YefM family antitoxin component YafN of YafNO toxin-antitoxin module
VSNAQTPQPDFVTDQNGKRKAVILSFEEYEDRLEDLDDLAVVAERQVEETICHQSLRDNLHH